MYWINRQKDSVQTDRQIESVRTRKCRVDHDYVGLTQAHPNNGDIAIEKGEEERKRRRKRKRRRRQREGSLTGRQMKSRARALTRVITSFSVCPGATAMV